MSEILRLMNVRTFLSRRLEGGGRWALRFPAYKHLKFGGILRGLRWLWIEGGEAPVRLEAGDFYLMSDGRPYCFASDPEATPLDGVSFMEEHVEGDGVVRFGESQDRTVGIGGRFLLDDDFAGLLLEALPPLVVVRGGDTHAGVLGSLLTLMSYETATARAGASVAASNLCSLVLVNLMRSIRDLQEQPRGWLAALKDRSIGGAIQLLHAEPARRWTVEGLALQVGMSRASFAKKFVAVTGTTPLEYLTRWRMSIACERLRDSSESLTSIATEIGYESDVSFGIAFKHRIGTSPGKYRARQKTSQE